MTDETKGGERVIDKIRATLIDLMDHEDAAIRLEAAKVALGKVVLFDGKEESASMRGQPGRRRGRQGGEE